MLDRTTQKEYTIHSNKTLLLREVIHITTHFLRGRLRCNQREFSRLLGVDYRTVTNWDARDTFPVYLNDLLVWILDDETTKKRFLKRLEDLRNGS